MVRIARLARQTAKIALYAWMPVTLVLLWWFCAPPKSLYFPALWSILDDIQHQWIFGLVRADLIPSLEHLVFGYGLAVLGGIALGTVLYAVPVLYKISLPVISFFRGLPSIALIPPLLLVLGLGGTFKVGVIAIGAVQPVLLNTVNGLHSIDEIQLETGTSYGLSRWQLVLEVMLPAASPQIVAGCRTGLQAAVLLMVASEIVASTSGIGFEIVNAQQSFDGPGMWSGMVILGLLGIAMNLVFIVVERAGAAVVLRNASLGGDLVMIGVDDLPSPSEGAAAESAHVLVIEDLAKTYQAAGHQPKEAIRSISFVTDKEELVCVVGPSGAGKTTLLRCLAGLIAPTSGAVLFEGEAVRGTPAEAAVVFQDYGRSLFPWLTVANNIALPLKNRGLRAKERRRLVEGALDAVGLPDVSNRHPWQLSGGMQQRVAIARALAYRPKLLLMDEPFASVDAQTRFELEDLVLRLRSEFGMTIVFVTHDIDEAVYVGNRIVVLSRSPCVVKKELTVDLPVRRDQVTTRSDTRFVRLRTMVLELVTGRDES